MTLKVVWINVTNACNLRCAHCGYSSGAAAACEMTTAEITGVFAQMASLGVPSAVITGGEPFLRPDIWDLISSATDHGIRLAVATNGTTFPIGRFAERLHLLRKCYLSVSLDGHSPASNDTFRGRQGAFCKTTDFIERCYQAGIHLEIDTVVNALNLNEMPDMIRWVVSKGFTHRILNVVKQGRASQGLYQLTPSQALEFWNQVFFPLFRELQGSYDPVPLMCELPVAMIPPDIPIASTCSWDNTMGIAADGSYGLCHSCLEVPELQVGKVRESSLADAWSRAQQAELKGINPLLLKGICGNCVFSQWCKGRCRAYSFLQYRDRFAPDVTCQMYYEAGLFPAYAMKSAFMDCHLAHPEFGSSSVTV